MKMDLRLVLVGVICFFSVGCAHSRLLSWKENEIAVCCTRACDENSWKEATEKYCTGNTTLVSELTPALLDQMIKTQETKSVGKWNTRLITLKEKCEVFNCSGEIQGK